MDSQLLHNLSSLSNLKNYLSLKSVTRKSYPTLWIHLDRSLSNKNQKRQKQKKKKNKVNKIDRNTRKKELYRNMDIKKKTLRYNSSNYSIFDMEKPQKNNIIKLDNNIPRLSVNIENRSSSKDSKLKIFHISEKNFSKSRSNFRYSQTIPKRLKKTPHLQLKNDNILRVSPWSFDSSIYYE